MLLFGPLFYIVFEVKSGETLFDHGITGSGSSVCPEHPAVAALNLSDPLCSCSQGRKGTAGQPSCTSARRLTA